MMTLPEMMRRALRLQHNDPSLRLVYQTAGWLRTPDGFHVSFALTAADLSEMAGATHEPSLESAPHPAKRRSVH